MIKIAQFKRVIIGFLVVSLLGGCNLWQSYFGREEVQLGTYITLPSPEVAEGSTVRWAFSDLPDTSKLTGFLPSDTSLLVSFKPDAIGNYDVLLAVTTNGEVEETNYYFEVILSEDGAVVETTIPEHLNGLEIVSDTAVTGTTQVMSLTDNGDPRQYLSKVVSPTKVKRPKATIKPKRPRVRAKKQVNRGNLIPKATKTYTIQVSSWPSLTDAQTASKELLENYGIDNYIQRAFFKDKDEVYYRIRVGNFKSYSAAEDYAKEIRKITNLPAWVDFIRQEM